MKLFRFQCMHPVEGRPIEDAGLLVDDGLIRLAGSFASVASKAPAGTGVEDFGDALVMPGFVNAHAHLELTCYRGRLSAGPLWPWLSQLIALRRKPGAEERERAGAALGAAESLASGVTLVGDISRNPAAAAVLAESPIRKVCFLELISGALQPPNSAASLVEGISVAQSFERDDELMIGVSPHAPYTVTCDDLRGAIRLARGEHIPWTIHLLETVDEVDWLAGQEGNVSDFLGGLKSPNANADPEVIKLLFSSDCLDANPLFAHVNYVSDTQIQQIASSGASVVWCPRAHAYYGHRNHRWRDLASAGVNVCVGTDSAACVTKLSILDELIEIHRIAPEFDLSRLLQLGTLNGARALGMDQKVGSLVAGKRADFVVFDPPRRASKCGLEPLFEECAAPRSVFVNGLPVSPLPEDGLAAPNLV